MYMNREPELIENRMYRYSCRRYEYGTQIIGWGAGSECESSEQQTDGTVSEHPHSHSVTYRRVPAARHAGHGPQCRSGCPPAARGPRQTTASRGPRQVAASRGPRQTTVHQHGSQTNHCQHGSQTSRCCTSRGPRQIAASALTAVRSGCPLPAARV